MMPGNRTPVENRPRLIEAHQRGDDFIALALQIVVNRTTAYSIVRLHQEYHRVEPLIGGGGRPHIIDNETFDLAVMLIEGNPLLTLNQLKNEILTTFTTKL